MNAKKQKSMRSAKEKKIMRIVVKAPNSETMVELMKEFRLHIGGRRPKQMPDDTWSMEAYVPEKMLDQLKEKGADFEIIEDATKVGKESLKEVGRGDRFEGGKITPHGLGRKE
jgi:hypothetical protein